MGIHKESLILIIALGLLTNTHFAHAWGTYSCDIKEEGLQKIEEICTESTSKFNSPLTALESKLERVLDFVAEIKLAEDSWFKKATKAMTVERDLSNHEENVSPIEGRDRTVESNSDDDKEVDRERNKQQVRREERENNDDWQNKRKNNDDYDRQERRDRSDRNDRIERRREEDREEKREKANNEDKEYDDGRRMKNDKKDGPKKGACEVQIMDTHETIGMFYMMSYQHGHCANRNPIREPIRYCLGYCATRTFIDRESVLWSQGNDCKSCQATKIETLRIPLTCDDGYNFEKKFNNIVECDCKRCKVPDGKSKN
ncbi:hypothetical protein SK128_013345 [Halocaridina rubra]|uniref:CTCK domain-containing protein n=1 Tax=Halocaridina rubra TaxID=373956 RepID=A0AAN8WFQ3_HALRR